ncbi:MAG: phosphodiester glycosidase family protein [Anaerolineae bacterium]|nr:phosphodiester glycosidase family protein [Anaerolineae bacterium]
MKWTTAFWWGLALLITASGCRAAAIGSANGASSTLFQGVEYVREVRSQPRDMVIHVVTVDLKAKGVKVLVTPGDPEAERPLKARTTSEFLEDFDLQLAINADAFFPWHVTGPFYAPHSGDAVDVFGFAASKGTIYSENQDSLPTLYVNKNNKASINNKIGKVHNAVSGTAMLVRRGKALADLGDNVQPRSAVGLDRAGRRLILVVVDGRQAGYSEGATLAELAQILIKYGAYDGFNLDGGGSSTLVMAGEDGRAGQINSPIHLGIAGNERPVGNHLGIYAREER